MSDFLRKLTDDILKRFGGPAEFDRMLREKYGVVSASDRRAVLDLTMKLLNTRKK